jgi:hypothetical protein
MRGQQSLFANIFVDTAVKPVQKQRPRNYYQPERNEALVHRYYFHAEINRMRFDDCIKQLESEFHITAPRIVAVLTQCTSNIQRLHDAKPSLKDLEKKFPWYAWKQRA